MTNLLAKLKAGAVRAWDHFDPKLKYTVLTGVVTYALTKAAINLDPTLSAIITGAISSAVGYSVPNEATTLRREGALNDGEPDIPNPPRLDAVDEEPLAGIPTTALS